MTHRAMVLLEVEDGQDLEELLDLDSLDANVIYQDELVDLDQRQRGAITDLLLGFDLPVEMMSAANNMLLASFVDKGATIGQMGPANRRLCLEKARAAIDEMLGEM